MRDLLRLRVGVDFDIKFMRRVRGMGQARWVAACRKWINPSVPPCVGMFNERQPRVDSMSPYEVRANIAWSLEYDGVMMRRLHYARCLNSHFERCLDCRSIGAWLALEDPTQGTSAHPMPYIEKVLCTPLSVMIEFHKQFLARPGLGT